MFGPHRALPRWSLARRATALAFLALLIAQRFTAASLLCGSTPGTTVFGAVPLTDPLAFLEATLASRAWLPRAALGAGLLAAAALALGPVYCGWLCPLGSALDLAFSFRTRIARRVLQRRGEPPRRMSSATLRNALLLAVLAFALGSGRPVFGALAPPHLLARCPALACDPWLWLLLGLFALEFAVPRLWCRALCPQGALYAWLGRRAPLRVRVESEHGCRSGCGLCSVNCPMGIAVMSKWASVGEPSIDDPACTRCGACLDACPRGLLVLGWKRRRARAPAGQAGA